MVIGNKIENVKKWVLTRFFSLRDEVFKVLEIFPLLGLIGVTLIFIHFMATMVYFKTKGIPMGAESRYYFAYIQLLLKHYFDSSLLTIIFMFGVSRNYSRFTWLCFIKLVVLWLFNSVYMLFDFETGLYYALYNVIIYAIFVVTALRILRSPAHKI